MTVTSAPVAHGVNVQQIPPQTQFRAHVSVNSHSPPQTSKSLPNPPLTAVALYDFASNKSNEQPLKKGEIVRVIAKGPAGGWTRGANGVFPTDYVRFQDIPQTIHNSSNIPPTQTNSILMPQPTVQTATPSGIPLPVPSSISLTAQPSSAALTTLTTDFGEFQAGEPKLSSQSNLDILPSSSVGTGNPIPASEMQSNKIPTTSLNAFEFVDSGKSAPSSGFLDLFVDFSHPSTASSATESRANEDLRSRALGQVPPSLLVPSTSNVDALLFPEFVDVDKSSTRISNTSDLLEISSDFGSNMYDGNMQVSDRKYENDAVLNDLMCLPPTTTYVRGKGLNSIDRDLGANPPQKVFIGSLHNRHRFNEHDTRRGRDRQVFSLNDSEEERRDGIWTQPFFSDLFTSSLIKRVEDSSSQPVMARLGDAFQAVRLAIAQVKGLSRRDGEIADVLSLVSSAFKEARDVCNEIPINAQDHQKFAEFLARFMPRVKHLRQGELVVSPCVWSSASAVVEEDGGTKGLSHNFHGVIILVYRTTEGTEEDFSLTIVNTSKENRGLDDRAVEVNNADGATMFNLAFELVNIPNARIQNTAFWLLYAFICKKM